MWEAIGTAGAPYLSRDMPCPYCGHAAHTFLPCSDSCVCLPRPRCRARSRPECSGPAGTGVLFCVIWAGEGELDGNFDGHFTCGCAREEPRQVLVNDALVAGGDRHPVRGVEAE